MNIGLQVFRAQNRVLSLLAPQQAVQKAGHLFFTPRRRTGKQWELEAEHQGNRVTLKNGTSALVWGTGIPILLTHGWEGRATQMAGFIEPLTSRGYQLIALDAPAHGLSLGQQSNPMKFVETMFLAEAIFGPFHAIIGHSMGGGCSLYAAAEGLATEKVVSIAGPSSFLRVSKRFADFIGLSKHAKARFIKHVETNVGIPFEKIDLLSRADELTLPTLVVHDRDDQEIPFKDAQQIAHSLAKGHLYETVGLGHRAIMRSSVMIDTVTNFIELDDHNFLDEAI